MTMARAIAQIGYGFGAVGISASGYLPASRIVLVVLRVLDEVFFIVLVLDEDFQI